MLGPALEAGPIATRSATIISSALDKVRHPLTEDTITRMEHALTAHGMNPTRTSSPKWPSAGSIRSTRTVPNRPRKFSATAKACSSGSARHGLHHIEIFATAEQLKPS